MINRVLNIIFIFLFCIILYLFYHFFPDLVSDDIINQKNISFIVIIFFSIFLLIYAINEFISLDRKIKKERNEHKLKFDSMIQSYESKISGLKNEIEFVNNKLARQRDILFEEYSRKLEEYRMQTEARLADKPDASYIDFINNLKQSYLREFREIFGAANTVADFQDLKNKLDKISFLLGNLCYSYFKNVDFFKENIFSAATKIEVFSDNLDLIRQIIAVAPARVYISKSAESNIAATLAAEKKVKELYIINNIITFDALIINSLDFYLIFEKMYIYIFNSSLIDEFRAANYVEKKYEHNIIDGSEAAEDSRKLPF